jgi:hypothetical protein
MRSRFLTHVILFAIGIVTLGDRGEVRAQPGPLQTISIPVAAGTESIPSYTPVAMSYYPYYNGVLNDSVKYILGTQLVAGSSTTADRIMDAASGSYAYRNAAGQWSGSLTQLVNRRAFLIVNRHTARTITFEGYPADSVTYISPMPSGEIRYAGPRMLSDHRLDSVGFVYSGIHQSQDMRHGGDLVIDLSTRQIARLDSTLGWIGTLSHLRVGHAVMIQTNHIATFDWTYWPGRR